jgi:carboxylesterase type B
MRAPEATLHPYVLSTLKGSLKGLEFRDRSGKPVLYRFTKVPFAQPPVRNLRWRRPQPLAKDFSFSNSGDTPGDYTHFGPICPQPIYDHSQIYLDNAEAAEPIENVQDEDCLYMNIWVPASTPPKNGWPVQFHIHGGWLQVGNANQSHEYDPFDLIANTTPRIVVSPTYRLNLFGFLAGADLASLDEESAPSNFGLWDQRCALEWVSKNIHLFSGDASNITLGGHSAGANSTFFQLNYDLLQPVDQRIIKRIYLWSNAVGIQPNKTDSPLLTQQFNDLCSIFSISTTATPQDKLDALRKVPSAHLITGLSKMKMHTFRSSTDDDFIPATTLSSLHSGTFTTRLADAGISVFLGEVCDEKNLYKLVNPPTNYDGLLIQLANYYPSHVVKALIPLYKLPDQSSTNNGEEWKEVFAQIVADGQVHASLRGLTHALLHPLQNPGIKALPKERLHRYRISWRAKALANWIDPSVGVTHGLDMPVWWASGYRADYIDSDKDTIKKFLEPFGKFLEGKEEGWKGVSDEKRIRFLDEKGEIHEDVGDQLWDRGMSIWSAVWESQKDLVVKEDGPNHS